MTVALLLASDPSFAYDFEVDGIYYNKLSENTVEVTSKYNDYGKTPTESYCGEITIPATITVDGVNYNITAIGGYAFRECGSLTSAILPEGISIIKYSAFYKCSSLLSINIPSTVTSIDDMAFAYCESLASINLPEGLTDIGDWAFAFCYALNSINLPSKLVSIGENAFSWCPFETISIPASVKEIGENAFHGNSISSIYIYDINNWYNYKDAKEDYHKYDLYINDIILSDWSAPEDMTIIKVGLFRSCKSLKSITLHNGIKSISSGAFEECKNITVINCQSETPPTCGADALTSISKTNCTLYIPDGCLETYKNTSPWNEFANIKYANGGTPATCEAPTITFDSNTKELLFASATEGAECHYTITSDDINTSEITGNAATMTGVYTITAYASANGMYNSEKTTVKLCWINAADEETGILNAKTERGVVISTSADQITISGTINGETIEVYNVGGSKIKSVNASSDITTINGLQNGTYIIKIGKSNIKVIL